MARVQRTPPIDPANRRTWVKPVEVKDNVHAVTKAHIYRAEYTVPATPNSIIMAMAQLPKHVPRDLPSYPRFYDVKANPRRDGRNVGGFAIEITWPGTDLFEGLEEELDRLDREVIPDEDDE